MTFSRLWLTLFGLGVIWVGLSGQIPAALIVAFVWYALLTALALADWRLLPAPDLITVTREVEAKLSLGADNPVTLRVSNTTAILLRLQVRNTPPPSLPNDLNSRSNDSLNDERHTGHNEGYNKEYSEEYDDRPLRFDLSAGSRQVVTYHLRPRERGDYDFGDIYVRVQGRLGMVSRIRRVHAAQRVAVYPNLRDAARYGVLARRGHLGQTGIRKARLQGAGREFESLRDYQPGDEMRRVDWKATARRTGVAAVRGGKIAERDACLRCRPRHARPHRRRTKTGLCPERGPDAGVCRGGGRGQGGPAGVCRHHTNVSAAAQRA